MVMRHFFLDLWICMRILHTAIPSRTALIMSDSQGALENYCLGQAATGQSEDPETMQRLLDQVTPERIRAAAQSVTLDTVYFLHGKEEA